MDSRTRANIALFWRMLPKEARSHLFIREDLCEVTVYVVIPDDSLNRSVNDAHELTMAESRYCPGFDFFPVSARHAKRGMGIQILLRDTLRFVPNDGEK